MKIIVIGASGTIGKQVVTALAGEGREVIRVGRSAGDLRADLTSRESLRELFGKVGKFEAVVSTAGEVVFAPLAELGPAAWERSIGSKLLGQIQIAQEALPFLADGGSITLVSGTLSEDPIVSGVAASTVDAAIDGFVRAAAIELPRGIRINGVNPTVLEESMDKFGPFFPGVIPVAGARVGQAFKRAVLGRQTGQVYRVLG